MLSVGVVGVVGAETATAAPATKGNAAAGSTASLPGFYKPGANTIVKRNEAPDLAPTAVAQPDGTVARVCNVKYVGQECGLNVIQSIMGPGPVTLSLAVSKAVAAQWSSNVSITAGDVTAGVGWSVTKTYTITDTATFPVRKGQFGELDAYPLYDEETFSVTDVTGTVHGNGYALKPVGVCFNSYAS